MSVTMPGSRYDPTRPKLKPAEHAELLARYNDLRKANYNDTEACELLGPLFRRHPATIKFIIRRLQPTCDLAQALLRAGSVRLAARVIRKANVAEAIDVLSRANIGVLAPKVETGGGGGGFFLTVNADSCGAVKVGVAAGAESLQLQPAPISKDTEADCNGYTLPSPKEDTGADYGLFSLKSTPDPEPHAFQGRIGRFDRPESEWNKDTQATLQAARKRLSKARSLRNRESAKRSRERHAGEPSVQGADGHTEDEGLK